MPSPMQLPMRVLVKGASNVLWTSMMGGPRSDLVFARAMEAELLAGGRATEVRNGGVLGMPIYEMFKTWEDEVARWSPDVIVMAVGQYDILHTLLPHWLERAANRIDRRPAFFQRWFYRRFLRLVARGALLTQRRIDRPGHKLDRRSRHAIRDLAEYIKITKQVGSPLIILLEIHPPTAAKIEWFGGWDERIAVFNDRMRELAEADESGCVRFVEMMDLTAGFDPGTPEQLWADGIHFNPAMHRLVGQRLAAVAEEWARTQPHLAQP
jgi:lysophospholipase L1-like esterase